MALNDLQKFGLSENSFEELQQAIDGTKLVDQQIKKAIQAGIDVGNSAELNKQNRERLMKIKQTYFPGK